MIMIAILSTCDLYASSEVEIEPSNIKITNSPHNISVEITRDYDGLKSMTVNWEDVIYKVPETELKDLDKTIDLNSARILVHKMDPNLKLDKEKFREFVVSLSFGDEIGISAGDYTICCRSEVRFYFSEKVLKLRLKIIPDEKIQNQWKLMLKNPGVNEVENDSRKGAINPFGEARAVSNK